MDSQNTELPDTSLSTMTRVSGEPFQINVSDELLHATGAKLAGARFSDELEDIGWEDGTPTAEIRKLRDFRLESYDWRAEEANRAATI
jgi:hypothetical protein